jgi:hypothetical protein
MELLVLWCEARAAQQRLRNTFRESSKPDNELMLNLPGNVGTHVPHRLPIGHKSVKCACIRNETQTPGIS